MRRLFLLVGLFVLVGCASEGSTVDSSISIGYPPSLISEPQFIFDEDVEVLYYENF